MSFSNVSRNRSVLQKTFIWRSVLIRRQSEAWNTTHAMLQNSSLPVEARLFAATTLKGKVRECQYALDPQTEHFQINYDLHQLPQEALTPLRDSLLSLLQLYISGPRPIRTQLCVCLAILAIQLTSWKDVLNTVGSAVGNSSEGGDCLLDFLRILPEEVTEGRRINLSVCSTTQHLMFGSAAAPSWPPITV